MILVLILNGCGEEAMNEKKPDEGKKVIIGVDINFPPYTFKGENGEIVGFDVDLAKETMRRLNRSIEFKEIDWSRKHIELQEKHIDMIWSGLDINEQRKEVMSFMKPYLTSGQIIFINRSINKSQITDKSKLAGMVVGIQKDTSAETHINEDNNLKYTIKELRLYDDYPTAFTDLAKRDIDAVICDEINGRYFIFKNNLKNKINALDIYIGEKDMVSVGFRKDDVTFREEVQKTFNEMIEDGTAQRISERWFGNNLIIK